MQFASCTTSLLYVIFSKNSFSLLSVLGVCRSSEKRVQRYSFYQYPPNISHVFLKEKCSFSVLRTKRRGNTLLYYREPALSPHREEGNKKACETGERARQRQWRHCKAATYRTQHYERPRTSATRRKTSTTKDREPALRGRRTKLREAEAQHFERQKRSTTRGGSP